jgi:hypothetical protein
MQSQAHNLTIVDHFITGLEYKVLNEWFATDRTPSETYFLSAQSQMWIFAAYELLRTWRERMKDLIKWTESGGLEVKLKALRTKNYGYMHYGNELRMNQIEAVLESPQLAEEMRRQLTHLHIPFTRLEFIRVAIAKHVVSGKEKTPALWPVAGRINKWCGALDYDLENGNYSMGTISRRDIADEIRALDFSTPPPSDEDLKNFDDFMRGKS